MFYQLLDSIKEKPAFFLNQPSATGLHSFLLGWKTAKNAYQLPQDEDERDFAGFQQWITKRYNIGTSQSWPRIITFYAMDEKESLALFFELLHEYRESGNQSRSPKSLAKTLSKAEQDRVVEAG